MNDEGRDGEKRRAGDHNQVIHDFLGLGVENFELLKVDCSGPADRRNEIGSADAGRPSRLLCFRIRGSDGVLTNRAMTFNKNNSKTILIYSDFLLWWST